jgi:mRNA interferase RelE/StbE
LSTEPGGGWVFTPRARRDLRRLDRPVQRRIVEALDRLVGDPPAGDVVKLTGSDDEWRLRVGDFEAVWMPDERIAEPGGHARVQGHACAYAYAWRPLPSAATPCRTVRTRS